MIPPPPRSTLFPYTTLFRSNLDWHTAQQGGRVFPLRNRVHGRPIERRNRSHNLHVLHSSAFVDDGLKNDDRSEEHTSELQSHVNLVCRLLLEKKKKKNKKKT